MKQFPMNAPGSMVQIDPMVAQMSKRGNSLMSAAWAGLEEDSQMRDAKAAMAERERMSQQNTSGFGRQQVSGDSIDFGNAQANGGASLDAISMIKKFEGFREGTYWDVDAHRNGYGSDTMTDANGNFRKIKEGDRTDRAGADRDLNRRVNSEFLPGARKALGEQTYSNLTPGQNGVIASLAYNYGSLPNRIIGAIQSGDPRAAAEAIYALGSDNDGINRKRRTKEAQVFFNSARR